MKKKFSELTIHKQLDKHSAMGACLIEIENCAPCTMSFQLCQAKIATCLFTEFDRLTVGSSLRIMVLTEEREVKND